MPHRGAGPDDGRPHTPWTTDRIWFGGDYNPEQWDPATWAEDDLLMAQSRITTVTVGVFSWSVLEPEEGRFTFGWLDATLDRLHAQGIQVVLATPTASPPPWFTLAHPDALPVSPEGTRLWHGSRDTYCAAAPAYRRAALRMAAKLAARYADHPALALWHVHNEYGTLCWCDHTAGAFRRWLRACYGEGAAGLDALNEAWGTTFWSQRYSTWRQVLPPRATQYLHNPSHTLDFRRFWSDELLAAYREQRDEIRRHTPDVPVTTNFMLPDYQNLDLWRWSREVDVVAVDHYLGSPDPLATGADLAFGADRARSFNGGRPWVLMEQAANLVVQPDRLLTKSPGASRRDTLSYLARGADTAMFFQWRASRSGAELHHASLVPHAGRRSRVYRETVELGDTLHRLAEVTGSMVFADVAVLWDADSWWGLDNRCFPSGRLRYPDLVRETHAALWRNGITTDFAAPGADLSGYRLVLAPGLYLLGDAEAANLDAYVRGGGHLLLGCFSGVADTSHRIRLGGFPGGLRETLGLTVTEWHPLPDEVSLALDPWGHGRWWAEDLDVEGAEVVARYGDGPVAGGPAITRHPYGEGTGWYLSTVLDAPSLTELVGTIAAQAGVSAVLPDAPTGLDAVRRRMPDGASWLFLTNFGAEAATVAASGHDLVGDRAIGPSLVLAPGEVVVIREARPAG